MQLSARMRAIALAAATAIAVPAVGFVATSSARATADDDKIPPPEYSSEAVYKGRTITTVNVRKWPTPASKKLATLKKGTTINIVCKHRGPSVDGNRLWYLFEPAGPIWRASVSARYVENVGKAPRYCDLGAPDGQVIAKPAVKIRTSPSLTAKTVGTIKYGTQFHTTCKVNGPKVDGNPRWYQLRDGTWVPARWVKNINDRVPEPC